MMDLKIVQDFIPAGRINRPAYKLVPKYVTIHNTANPNATAKNHADYIKTQACADREASWHFSVDHGTTIYQHLPLNENAWHCGDGTNGTGNRQSIGIEICEFTDNAKQLLAEKHAAWLCAKMLKDYKLDISKVKQHYNWSGKDCPRVLRKTGRWKTFLKDVEGYLPAPQNKISRIVGIEIKNSLTGESGYVINNSTYIRGAYSVALFGGSIAGKGSYVDITLPKEIETTLPPAQKPVADPIVTKEIGVWVNGKETKEIGYLINNATYIRAAFIIELAGGIVEGLGDRIRISFPEPKIPDLSKVVFRVFINGTQVIALTGFDKAKEYALAEYPNEKIELQNVETGEKIKVQDKSESIPEPEPEPEPIYEYKLIGKPAAMLAQARAWAKSKGAHQRFVDVASFYWQYGELTGLRADILYAQSAHETNFGKYTGNVIPEQNNWAGIKTKNPTGDKRDDHEYFASPEDGVRGHFNHMCAYTGLPPVGDPHDRYYVALSTNWAGKVKYLEELSGKWAPSATYHTKIVQFLNEIIATPEPEEEDVVVLPEEEEENIPESKNVFLELLKAIIKIIINWIKGGK